MKFRHTQLENGMDVLAECNDAGHSIALGFFVRAGSRDENDENSGVSHFLEHMAFKGTPERSADEINRAFDDMGADSNAFTSEEQTAYYVSLLPELQAPALELLAGLLRPGLESEAFELEKQVILEEINMYADQPPYGADDRAREIFFGSHPLGRSVLGTTDSITGLTREIMYDYWDSHYSPENIVLVGAGKIQFEELLKSAENLTRTWKSANGKTAKRELCKIKGNSGFHYFGKSSAVQSHLMEFADGPSSESPETERFAAGILAGILGDDSGSRLYWKLQDPGLAESAGLGVYEYLDNGFFMTWMSCAPDAAKSNIEIIRETYQEAIAQGITEEELHRAKTKIASRIVLSSERPRGRLFGIAAEWIAKREYRSVRDDLESLKAVTIEDVNTVLQKYPLQTPLQMLVGPDDNKG